jgi:hypothetical protein
MGKGCTCFECGTCSGVEPCACICFGHPCKRGEAPFAPVSFDPGEDWKPYPGWLAAERLGVIFRCPIRSLSIDLLKDVSGPLRCVNPLQALAAIGSAKTGSLLIQGGKSIVVLPREVGVSESLHSRWIQRGNGDCGCGGSATQDSRAALSASKYPLGNLLLHVLATFQQDLVVPIDGADWESEASLTVEPDTPEAVLRAVLNLADLPIRAFKDGSYRMA